MKLKKVLAITLCSALVATGSGVSTMAGAVTNGLIAEKEQGSKSKEMESDKEVSQTTETTQEEITGNQKDDMEEVPESTTEAAEEETTAESTESAEEESAEESTESAEEESTEESTENAEVETTEESTEGAEEETTEESTESAEEESTEESTESAEEESTEESTEESSENLEEETTPEESTEAMEEETTTEETTGAVSEEVPQLKSELVLFEENGRTVGTEGELREAVQTDGEINLSSDITLAEKLYINADITILGNGYSIEWGGDNTWNSDDDNAGTKSMIAIQPQSDATFRDITINSKDLGEDWVDEDNSSFNEYEAITVGKGGSLTIEDDTNIISEFSNANITTGILVFGQCTMNGGKISGFTANGVGVNRGGDFILNGGEITNIKHPNGGGWGGVGLGVSGNKENPGTATLNGGTISDCQIGIFNHSNIFINGGDICNNESGLVNSTIDNISKEEFQPKVVMSGGSIYENWSEYEEEGSTELVNDAVFNKAGESSFELTGEGNIEGEIWNEADALFTVSGGSVTGTIYNRKGGKVVITGGEVSGPVVDVMSRIAAFATDSTSPYVIKNYDEADLKIEGGTVQSDIPGGIVVSNGETGTFTMTGGEIIASGAQSVAFVNENKKIGVVKLIGGTINASGEGGKALEDKGYTEISGDMTVQETSAGATKYLVRVQHNPGGTVSPTSHMNEAGQVTSFTITPDNEYKISDVIVDGESKGAVSSYQLTVSKAHSIEATFIKKSSSGGGNGGGGGGSSRSISTSSQSKIPETPGTWVQDQKGWKFALPTGSDYLNTWIYVKGQWYRIGLDGYMMQGWVVIDGKTYYLAPMTGEMKTGWFIDNGSYYYLDSAGVVSTGWVQVNGAWYYLNTDGKMAVDTTTPDGYKVGADGKRIQ